MLMVSTMNTGVAQELLQATVAAFSVMGGVMAYISGLLSALGLFERRAPEVIAHRVNQGIGWGFIFGAPAAVIALIIEGWT